MLFKSIYLDHILMFFLNPKLIFYYVISVDNLLNKREVL